MKRIIFGMALGLSALATPAMAGTFDAGDLSGAVYGNPESFTSGPGSFDSTYSFTLSQSSIVHLSLTDNARLTGLTATLYNVTAGNTVETTVGPLDFINTPTGDWQSTSALGVGTYKVDIVGNYLTHGSYTLELSSQVAAPVPGPAGFIVAGAGALVVAARKRRKTRLAVA